MKLLFVAVMLVVVMEVNGGCFEAWSRCTGWSNAGIGKLLSYIGFYCISWV